jgi:hypothetical protein
MASKPITLPVAEMKTRPDRRRVAAKRASYTRWRRHSMGAPCPAMPSQSDSPPALPAGISARSDDDSQIGTSSRRVMATPPTPS